MSKTKKSKGEVGAFRGEEQALVMPVEMAFVHGNYARVHSLAGAILRDQQLSVELRERAQRILFRVQTDPRIMWIGVGTFIFAFIMAAWATR